jgi:hypothetical protein
VLAQASGSDASVEAVGWALVVAVFGLLLREGWQAWRARQDQRERDRLVLSALLREISAIHGLANGIVSDVERERGLLADQSRWRLKPLVGLPTGTYELVKDRPPSALLRQAGALIDLIRLQVQCTYTNALAHEQQRWKTPAASERRDQAETIASFHPAILESVNVVIERCDRLAPALRTAGERVGGLNLEGRPS